MAEGDKKKKELSRGFGAWVSVLQCCLLVRIPLTDTSFEELPSDSSTAESGSTDPCPVAYIFLGHGDLLLSLFWSELYV